MNQNYKSLKIFKWVESSAVNEVIENAEKELFAKDRLIIYEWERIDNKGYIILSGWVSIQIQKIEIAKLWIWEIFWEIGLIVWEKREATVRTLLDTEVLVIDFDKLMLLIDHDENNINKEVIRRMQQNLLLE